MPRKITSELDIHVGDIYEDCAFHPCLCVKVGDEGDPECVHGISLVDARTRCCSARQCGVRILTVEEAIQWKYHGPADESLEPSEQWWTKA